MPESVDSPAPESTSTSPSATRAASASSGAPGIRSGAVSTAVTGPWSPTNASARRELLVEPLEHRRVDPRQPLGREGALEEAADAARPGPARADPHRAHSG